MLESICEHITGIVYEELKRTNSLLLVEITTAPRKRFLISKNPEDQYKIKTLFSEMLTTACFRAETVIFPLRIGSDNRTMTTLVDEIEITGKAIKHTTKLWCDKTPAQTCSNFYSDRIAQLAHQWSDPHTTLQLISQIVQSIVQSHNKEISDALSHGMVFFSGPPY